MDTFINSTFGAFSRCDSMGEICDGMMGMQGKLQPLGLESSPTKSTVGDGLRNRDNTFFEAVYFMLLNHFKPILSVSRIDRVSFSKLFIFDSSTIDLFSQVMKGVGRNPKGQGKKKGGLKVHMMIDAHSDTPEFVKLVRLKGRIYRFITNNWEISNKEVAYLYKLKWNIELLFKKLKQNFQLHYFYSETENGIKTQIWCTLIAQLLLMVLKVKSESLLNNSCIGKNTPYQLFGSVLDGTK